MQTWESLRSMLVGLIVSMASPMTFSHAEDSGAMVDGAGFTLYGTESIKGFDAAKVERDPICDRSKRPRIAKVEPDEVKSGDKVVITGSRAKNGMNLANATSFVLEDGRCVFAGSSGPAGSATECGPTGRGARGRGAAPQQD